MAMSKLPRNARKVLQSGIWRFIALQKLLMERGRAIAQNVAHEALIRAGNIGLEAGDFGEIANVLVND